MTSTVPPPGVSIADARLEEVSDGIFAYIQPDGSWWINNTGFLVGRRGDRGLGPRHSGVLARLQQPRARQDRGRARLDAETPVDH